MAEPESDESEDPMEIEDEEETDEDCKENLEVQKSLLLI